MAQPVAKGFRTKRSFDWGRLSPIRGLAWLFGVVAWMAAGLVGAALALFLAVAVLGLATLSSLVVALAAVAVKGRRVMAPARDGALIEARRVGGHSWVAYGWDREI